MYRLPLTLFALLLLTATGCATTSPFVGQWDAVSAPKEVQEEVDAASLTLDADGYALAQASSEEHGEGIAFEAAWEQATDNRMRVELEFKEMQVAIVGWLTGPDTMTATIIVGDKQEAVTVELERADRN